MTSSKRPRPLRRVGRPGPAGPLAGWLQISGLAVAVCLLPGLLAASEPHAAAAKADRIDPAPVAGPVTFPQGRGEAEAAGGPAAAAGLSFDWQAWGIVLAAVAGAVGLRLASRRRSAGLPPDVFAVLGETMLGGQAVRVVRFGPKTLLLTGGSGGPRTLAELDDPLAAEWIAAACRGDTTLRTATPVGGGRAPRAADSIDRTGESPGSSLPAAGAA